MANLQQTITFLLPPHVDEVGLPSLSSWGSGLACLMPLSLFACQMMSCCTWLLQFESNNLLQQVWCSRHVAAAVQTSFPFLLGCCSLGFYNFWHVVLAVLGSNLFWVCMVRSRKHLNQFQALAGKWTNQNCRIILHKISQHLHGFYFYVLICFGCGSWMFCCLTQSWDIGLREFGWGLCCFCEICGWRRNVADVHLVLIESFSFAESFRFAYFACMEIISGISL